MSSSYSGVMNFNFGNGSPFGNSAEISDEKERETRVRLIDILRGILGGQRDKELTDMLKEISFPLSYENESYLEPVIICCEITEKIDLLFFIKENAGINGFCRFNNPSLADRSIQMSMLKKALLGSFGEAELAMLGKYLKSSAVKNSFGTPAKPALNLQDNSFLWSLLFIAAASGNNGMLKSLADILRGYSNYDTMCVSDIILAAVKEKNYGAVKILSDKALTTDILARFITDSRDSFVNEYLRKCLYPDSTGGDGAIMKKYFADYFKKAELSEQDFSFHNAEIDFLTDYLICLEGRAPDPAVIAALPAITLIRPSEAFDIESLKTNDEFFSACGVLFPESLSVKLTSCDDICREKLSAIRKIFRDRKITADVSELREHYNFGCVTGFTTVNDLRYLLNNYGIAPDESGNNYFIMLIVGKKSLKLLSLAVQKGLINDSNIDSITAALVKDRNIEALNTLNNLYAEM